METEALSVPLKKLVTNLTPTLRQQHKQTLPPSSSPSAVPKPDPSPPFDPSRMIGIIKRKALIKELASVYHEECLAYCQELLELQKKWEEPFVDSKPADDSKRETMRPPKRTKKSR